MNILITGGVSGLGKAISEKLAIAYPDKIIYATFCSSEEAAQKMETAFKNIKTIKCDFTSASEVLNLAKLLGEWNLGYLVNNAITGMDQNYFHKTDPEYFLNSFKSNILPTIQITQACLSIFRKQKFGKIVNILSSAIVNTPPIGMSEYAASKAYLRSLSNSWAVENIKFNVSSNSVSPAMMRTTLTSYRDERLFEEMIAQHPLKKLVTLEEVAESVLFLCNASQHVNGVNLLMNAGESIQ